MRGVQPVGALRHRVRIERRVESWEGGPFSDQTTYDDGVAHAGEAYDDGAGNRVGDWGPAGGAVAAPVFTLTRPARIAPRTGGEEVQAARLAGTSQWDIWVRSDAGTRQIRVEDRAVDVRTGQTFNIRYIANLDERGRFLLLQCEAGVADG